MASRIDALIHPAIEAELAAPPSNPTDGHAWLIAPGASGVWAGRAGQIAARQAGMWFYLPARDGLRVFNRATQQFIHHNGTWSVASHPSAPSGGSVIDVEARAALAALLAALTTAGILAAS